MKTAELTGAALDWAVAKCIDDSDIIFVGKKPYIWCDPTTSDEMRRVLFQPSTDWSQGGPIIEREGLDLRKYRTDTWYAMAWRAASFDDSIRQYGPTPLIAAMRCLVASKLGDEVEIPKELTK